MDVDVYTSYIHRKKFFIWKEINHKYTFLMISLSFSFNILCIFNVSIINDTYYFLKQLNQQKFTLKSLDSVVTLRKDVPEKHRWSPTCSSGYCQLLTWS